jgi:hypothetical protein
MMSVSVHSDPKRVAAAFAKAVNEFGMLDADIPVRAVLQELEGAWITRNDFNAYGDIIETALLAMDKG